jgi:hypothetical protein
VLPPAPYNRFVDIERFAALPGADLVMKGLTDAAANVESIESLLLQIGAPKLRSLGLAVPHVRADGASSPEHRLYARLSHDGPDAAHGRYNALVRRLVSFERAFACASR